MSTVKEKEELSEGWGGGTISEGGEVARNLASLQALSLPACIRASGKGQHCVVSF